MPDDHAEDVTAERRRPILAGHAEVHDASCCMPAGKRWPRPECPGVPGPPLPVRRRWACTVPQLEAAIAAATAEASAQGLVLTHRVMAEAVTRHLPSLGDGLAVSRDDLLAVLAAAYGMCPDAAAFNRLTEAAGLTVPARPQDCRCAPGEYCAGCRGEDDGPYGESAI